MPTIWPRPALAEARRLLSRSSSCRRPTNQAISPSERRAPSARGPGGGSTAPAAPLSAARSNRRSRKGAAAALKQMLSGSPRRGAVSSTVHWARLALGVDLDARARLPDEDLAHVDAELDAERLAVAPAAALGGLLNGHRGMGGAAGGVLHGLEAENGADAPRAQLLDAPAEGCAACRGARRARGSCPAIPRRPSGVIRMARSSVTRRRLPADGRGRGHGRSGRRRA